MAHVPCPDIPLDIPFGQIHGTTKDEIFISYTTPDSSVLNEKGRPKLFVGH